MILATSILLVAADRAGCQDAGGAATPPLTYIIVIDTSASLRAQLTNVIEIGKTIARLSRPADEAAIVRFVSKEKIETLQDFTADRNALQETLDGLYVEYGQTAIMEAVEDAAELLVKRREKLGKDRRAALILLSDGDDRSSYSRREALIERLKEMDVRLYSVGVVQGLEGRRGNEHERALALLRQVSVGSGGRAYFPRTETEAQAAVHAILREARK